MLPIRVIKTIVTKYSQCIIYLQNGLSNIKQRNEFSTELESMEVNVSVMTKEDSFYKKTNLSVRAALERHVK